MVKEHPKDSVHGGQSKKPSYLSAGKDAFATENKKAAPEEAKGIIAKKTQNGTADEDTLEQTRAQLSKGKFVNFSKILTLVRA
jgi:hypothetical protein